FSDEDFIITEQLICDSWIVDGSNRNLFTTAFHFFKSGRYGRCSVLMFPQLEHALRKLFVHVNKCPSRLITAETKTFFTTFEEILERNLPDGQENGLIRSLSDSCMDLLHDLLVYPLGPRSRDKLSHGEADYTQVPSSLPKILLILLVWLVKDGNKEKEFRQKLAKCMSQYNSIFHPVSILRQKVLDLAYQSHELHAKITLSPELQPWKYLHVCPCLHTGLWVILFVAGIWMQMKFILASRAIETGMFPFNWCTADDTLAAACEMLDQDMSTFYGAGWVRGNFVASWYRVLDYRSSSQGSKFRNKPVKAIYSPLPFLIG
ncbi:endoplasmic reticulum membrane-associated RNA degradation protein-like, partial [Plakobranchus ocellatus]